MFVSSIVDQTGQVVNPVVTQDTDEAIKQKAIQALHIEGQSSSVEMTIPVFSVRRGKALSCGGCEPRPTPVTPVDSGLRGPILFHLSARYSYFGMPKGIV